MDISDSRKRKNSANLKKRRKVIPITERSLPD
jgi:hypothetical protein